MSSMYDEQTGAEYHNAWDIQDKGDELQTRVGAASDDARKFEVTSTDPRVIAHYRAVQQAAARAAYRRKRVLEAKTIEKPKSRPKPRPKPRRACPECDETGKVWVGDVEEICDRCEGKGWIS